MPGIASKVREHLVKFDRQVWMLFCGTIINVIGTSLVMPFLSIYMYEKMGISMTMVGLAFFVSMIFGAVAAYAGGALCDRYGRKLLFMIGLVLQIAAYIFISLSIDLKVSYPVFVTVLTFNAIIDGLYRPVPDVMVADVVAPNKRVEAYGLLRIGANLGWVIGPILGGILTYFALSYSYMFYVTALTTFVYLLLVIFQLRDTKPLGIQNRLAMDDIKVIVKDTPFMVFCIISLLLVIPYSQMYSLLSVYSSAYVGLTDFEVGVLFSVSGCLVALFQYPISIVVNRYRMTTALVVCTVVFAIGFGLIAASKNSIMLYVCISIITIAEMIWSPASATLQANMSPEDRRGRYFGFGGLFFTIGSAIGPLFGGMIKDSMESDITAMWLVIAAIFLVCTACFIAFSRLVPSRANITSVEEKAETVKARVDT